MVWLALQIVLPFILPARRLAVYEFKTWAWMKSGFKFLYNGDEPVTWIRSFINPRFIPESSVKILSDLLPCV